MCSDRSALNVWAGDTRRTWIRARPPTSDAMGRLHSESRLRSLPRWMGRRVPASLRGIFRHAEDQTPGTTGGLALRSHQFDTVRTGMDAGRAPLVVSLARNREG